MIAPALLAILSLGSAQAASALEGGESGEGRRLYDAALFWSLTTIQMAQTAARPALAAEADQTRARIRAVRELSAGDPGARADLQRCRAANAGIGLTTGAKSGRTRGAASRLLVRTRGTRIGPEAGRPERLAPCSNSAET